MSIDYAKLTVPQKWQWHAEVYALRRVMLGVKRDEHTSPCDPKGEWYDERLVGAAEERYLTRQREQAQRCRADTEAQNAIRFADGKRWRESAAGREFLGRPVYRRYSDADISDLQAKLGITAREFAPTPEQMTSGRQGLGIGEFERPEAAE